MGKTYDNFYDFVSTHHQSTKEIPTSQEVMDHFNLKTESQDPQSTIRDTIYDLIEEVISDYKKHASIRNN